MRTVGRVTAVEEPDEPAVAVASFAFELGVLKRIRRAGWWHVGVRDPESVAEHSLRVAQLAALIAAIEGADPGRATLLAIWHDSQETRTGDIPHTAMAGADPVPNNRVRRRLHQLGHDIGVDDNHQERSAARTGVVRAGSSSSTPPPLSG